MIKAFLTCSAVFLSLILQAQAPLERISATKHINDYADVLTPEEEQELEAKVSKDTSVQVVVVLTKGVIKSDAPVYASRLAQAWNLGENSFLLIHDLKHISYGFAIGKNVKSTYPDWIVEKIEHNHLRPNFREKNYFKGVDEAARVIVGLKTGTVTEEDLKKDSSGNLVLVLILVVVFFVIVFPIWQFFAMKKSHFSSKPVDFFTSVVLMNSFGSRGKNVFDDFTKGKGIFAPESIQSEVRKSFKGGGGIAGSW